MQCAEYIYQPGRKLMHEETVRF